MVETVGEVYYWEKRLMNSLDNMNLTGLISYKFSQEASEVKILSHRRKRKIRRAQSGWQRGMAEAFTNICLQGTT